VSTTAAIRPGPPIAATTCRSQRHRDHHALDPDPAPRTAVLTQPVVFVLIQRGALQLVAGRLRADPGYLAIQAIPGVGPVLAAVFVAEIGDIGRFRRAEQLASWAGLTPQHHESDTTVHRGPITKQGSRLVRWAAVEAVQRVPGHTRLGRVRDQVGQRRGRNIGIVAAARGSSSWCSTGCAITASGPCPVRRRSPRRHRRHDRPSRAWWVRVVLVMTPECTRRGRPV